MSNFLFVLYLSSLFLFYFGNLSLVIMRHKIVIIIKNLCSVILWGQLKVKKTLVLHYSIDRYATYTLPLNSKILMEYSFFFPWKLCSVIKNTSHKMTHAQLPILNSFIHVTKKKYLPLKFSLARSAVNPLLPVCLLRQNMCESCEISQKSLSFDAVICWILSSLALSFWCWLRNIHTNCDHNIDITTEVRHNYMIVLNTQWYQMDESPFKGN